MAIVERAVFDSHFGEKLAFSAKVRTTSSLCITASPTRPATWRKSRLYAALRDRGQLTVRLPALRSARWPLHHLSPDFLPAGKSAFAISRHWVSANLVKFFADGGTACSPVDYEPSEYKKLVMELDKRCFQIMTMCFAPIPRHWCWILTSSGKQNGNRDRRLRLEHADALNGEDCPSAKLRWPPACSPFLLSESAPGFDLPDKDAHRPLAKPAAIRSDTGLRQRWPCTWPPIRL